MFNRSEKNSIVEIKGHVFEKGWEEYLHSPLGESWGLKDKNSFANVFAKAKLIQDGSLVSPSSYWDFYLIRKNSSSPWLIANFGAGSFLEPSGKG